MLIACLAIAAVAFAIGRFTAFGAGTPATPASDSADAGFARDMQVHHAQAVDMAMQIYRKTDDDELRTLSYDIATAQSAQKGEMYDWLVSWGLPQSGGPLMSWMSDADHAGHGSAASPTSDADLRAAMGMATDAELTALAQATGTPADCLFLDLMIRHHEGAIPMADAVLARGSQPRVLEVAAAMKAGQLAEIDAMHSIQARLGCR
ncbi:DUF305 domain-containing protein [Microbacterium rhizomatis]|uniref:DUF305 domain-containing protein n=1 Tax=Microbacterium rhizomatis TaxID=1631477 RepID=A0A5J5J1R3_9MICO|nr:DUF305 domain-containing protein [Microbacterium rhizomatis]KAA9108486.1 DUF305 domain-containing protein [Microbacterium rhizomatis]